jgi:hypothetical protein
MVSAWASDDSETVKWKKPEKAKEEIVGTGLVLTKQVAFNSNEHR